MLDSCFGPARLPRSGCRLVIRPVLQMSLRFPAAAHRCSTSPCFDEMDEGTAIFKTTSKVPEGRLGSVTEPELRSDHSLWLCGQIGKALRPEIALLQTSPRR